MHDAVYSNAYASAQTESTPHLAEARNFARQYSNVLSLLPEHRNIVTSTWIRHLAKQHMPPRYMRVLNAIFSQTIDFKKRENDLSGGRLQQLTCIRADHANNTLKELEQDHAIITHTGSYGKWLSINFDFASWGKNKKIPIRTYNNDPRCLLPAKYHEPVDTGNVMGYDIDSATETRTPEATQANRTDSNQNKAPQKSNTRTNSRKKSPAPVPDKAPQKNPKTAKENEENTASTLNTATPEINLSTDTNLREESTDSVLNQATSENTRTREDSTNSVLNQATQETNTSTSTGTESTDSALNKILEKLLHLEQKMQRLEHAAQPTHTLKNTDQAVQDDTGINLKSSHDAEQNNTEINVKNTDHTEQQNTQINVQNTDHTEPENTEIKVKNSPDAEIHHEENTPSSASSTTPAVTAKTQNIPSKTQLAAAMESLHYPAEMNQETQQELTELLMPTGEDAQDILNVLVKRLQNTHNPVQSSGAYLNDLIQRYKRGRLDLSGSSHPHQTSSDSSHSSTPIQTATKTPQLTEKEQYLNELKEIYQVAYNDRQHIQRNINVLRRYAQQTVEEYLCEQGADMQKLWRDVNQTLQQAQQNLEQAMQD